MENNGSFRKKEFRIVSIQDARIKSAYTKMVLERLPDWFGNQMALEEYITKVAEFPYWAALNGENNCVGFFSAKIHYAHTGEIFVCGVLPEYHRFGIGKALYQKAEQYFSEQGCKYVVVKTLSDTIECYPYAKTRSFYKSMGFEQLITLTEMWDEDNPCLIMIKPLIERSVWSKQGMMVP